MDQKMFNSAAGIIFLAIAVLHLVRVVSGWEAVIGGWMVPMWLSWAAVIMAGYLSYSGLRHGRR